jgi:hypothetical protein
MKIGETVIAYGDPIKQRYSIGQVTLLSFIKETPYLELWIVERTDGQYGEMFIKKETDGKNIK